MKHQLNLDRALPSTGAEERTWGSDLAADVLRQLGIKYIAHNPGSSFRGLHDSIVNYLGNEEPSMLLCLNETQAMAVCHGYARVTNQPMGCMLHSNVGVLNAMMGIFDAWVDRVPVYIIGGGGPSDAARRLPWIHWVHSSRDQAGYARPFTKWDEEPRSPKAMVEAMLRTYIMGNTAPKGPTYLLLDASLQEDEAKNVELPDMARFQVPELPQAPKESIAKAAKLLAQARRPVIMAGRVSRDPGDWERRVKLAELLGAQVVTDMKTPAAFPTDHPQCAGIGWHMRGPLKEALLQADVILSLDWIDVGTVLTQAFGSQEAIPTLIQCSADSLMHKPLNMDHYSLPPADISLLVEADTAVEALLEALESGEHGPIAPKEFAPKADAAAAAASSDPSAAISVDDFGQAVSNLQANHKITFSRLPFGFPPKHCHFDDPLDYLGYDGAAAVGVGPGNTVGAGLALIDSDRAVVGVIGDGDFMQGGNALWTAAHYKIPVLIIVSNNRSHLNDELVQQKTAMQRGREEGNKWIGQRIDDPPVDVARIAEGFGVKAEGPVRTVGELAPALQRGLEYITQNGKPYVIDVEVLPEGLERLS